MKGTVRLSLWQTRGRVITTDSLATEEGEEVWGGRGGRPSAGLSVGSVFLGLLDCWGREFVLSTDEQVRERESKANLYTQSSQ